MAEKSVEIPVVAAAAADSSDDEDAQRPFVPFKQRPEWQDIEPIPQDDGPVPVLAIQYSDECKLRCCFSLL